MMSIFGPVPVVAVVRAADPVFTLQSPVAPLPALPVLALLGSPVFPVAPPVFAALEAPVLAALGPPVGVLSGEITPLFITFPPLFANTLAVPLDTRTGPRKRPVGSLLTSVPPPEAFMAWLWVAAWVWAAMSWVCGMG